MSSNPTGSPVPVSIGRGIGSLGGAFMISRYAKAAAAEQGFTGIWTSYLAGRVGVLGEVDADVVTAAIAFYPPDLVRGSWAAACATVPVRQAALRYAAACHAWGEARLGGFDGAGRLAELTLTVAREADVAGAPLFAAWRALPLPGSDEARAAHGLQLLREHRGAQHIAAVLSCGLTPLQAVLAGPGGEGNAVFFGWQPPFEDPTPYTAIREEAERRTELAAARPYAVLDDAELAELAALLETGSAHARERATLEKR